MLWNDHLGGIKQNGKYDADIVLMGIAELGLDDDNFIALSTYTAKYETTPPIDVLQFLKDQIKALPVITKTKASNSMPKKSIKMVNYHVRDQDICHVCKTSAVHPLYICPDFKEQTEQCTATVQKLHVCNNCLGLDHFTRSCPSKHSCK